jgi:hypothetical protein
VVLATAGGMLLGNLLSSGRLGVPFLAHPDAVTATRAADVGLGLLPVVLVLLAGIMLM